MSKHSAVKRWLIINAVLGLTWPVSVFANDQQEKDEVVILLHGFLGEASEFEDVAEHLEGEGYRVVVPEYETRSGSIEELADQVIPQAIEEAGEVNELRMVTHSMGGLLLRSYMERHDLPQLERVVMLAPPNHGSQVAEELGEYALYRQFSGPAGTELADIKLIPRKIGEYELGIIAGTASVNPIFSPILPGPDDGYVALESTPLKGMDDFITIPTSHGLITSNQSSIEQISYFLENGAFDHDAEVVGYPISTDDFREIQKYMGSAFGF